MREAQAVKKHKQKSVEDMAATTRTEDEYVFEYCSTAVSLREAYRLRLEVFHHEQKFPEETEIDE